MLCCPPFDSIRWQVIMLRISKLYLLSYNSFQFLGWSLALCKILSNFTQTKSIHGAYAAAGDLISLLQTISFLEVIHAATGLVPSGPLLALMQWGGRTHFLLAIVWKIPEVQHLPSVFITFLAWSISEVIRYAHYALSSVEICPFWLTYLRYTAFVLLYPAGIFPGEMLLMYKALPYIKDKNLYSNFFSRLPFSYYSFVSVLLVSYPFMWLKLYLHLFKQRKHKVNKHPPKREKKEL